MKEMSKLDKQIALRHLIEVEKLNIEIKRIQAKRDHLIDPLVKEFGSAVIDEMYTEIYNA